METRTFEHKTAGDALPGRHHWIYVLGGTEWMEKAQRWQQRKTLQDKSYAVIEGGEGTPSTRRLAEVGNEDVLYVFAPGISEGRLAGMMPAELAERLRAEGLDRAHRAVKLFASRSGDDAGGACFAERMYEAMVAEYPQAVVFGYRGQVDAEGFDGHKTAGMGEDQSLHEMSRETWLEKGARAQQNRVQFPAEDGGA